MKARLAAIVLIVATVAAAPSRGFSDWPNPKGGPQRDLGSVAVHPPFEIDWEEAVKPPSFLVCGNDRIVAVSTDSISIFSVSTLELVKNIHIQATGEPCINDGVLVVPCNVGIKAYSLGNGLGAWEYPTENVKYTTTSPGGFVVSYEKSLVFLDPKGNASSRVELENEITSCPVFCGEDKLVVPCRNSIVAIDLQSRRAIMGKTVADQAIYCTSPNQSTAVFVLSKGGSIAISVPSGEILWTNPEPKGSNIQIACDKNHVVLYGSSSGATCLRIDGKMLWKWSGHEVQSVINAGRLLLASCQDGTLQIVQVATGTSINPVVLPGRPTGTMAVDHGFIYLSCGPKLIRLRTSEYLAILGFNGDFDFGTIRPDIPVQRQIRAINLSRKDQEVKMTVSSKLCSIYPSSFTLTPGESKIVTITIKPYSILELEERATIVADTSMYRYVLGAMLTIKRLDGDVNLDCVVNSLDLVMLARSFGLTSKSPMFDVKLDLDKNGVIDYNDILIVEKNFGSTC
ncbi:MAG: PQQ-binding-like beta-propeller repeat protein [Caldisericales bacterium]|nr:PQQ-binding-like beta-propeller repeat protein [Caldisericales bacterium]